MQISWGNRKVRSFVFQGTTFLFVIGLFLYLFFETQSNLEKQNIASGLDFLSSEAGFEIGESLISYFSEDTYRRALVVGFLNTLKVAFIGNFLAIILGVILGIFRLSSNKLLSGITKAYIEVMRNTPLLLQLFFFYALITEGLPSVRQAISFFDVVYLSNRGAFFPILKEGPGWHWYLIALIVGSILYYFVGKRIRRLQQERGKDFSLWPLFLICFLGPFILTWLVGGMPVSLEIPVLRGFNFQGGMGLSPEFLALLIGLVLYTSAFNAEIVRSGIESVDHGQWEAARSLGLGESKIMGLVILPQALRVIIPPLTSQVLNLTKNSSLAVAIGYPDFVSVANTAMNQTGQAVELVALIMLCYLFFSLTTSFLMNMYNKKVSLKERS